MVIQLKPDSSNTNNCPDAGPSTSSDLRRVENCRKDGTLVRTKAENERECLPGCHLLLDSESYEEHAQAIVDKLHEALVKEGGCDKAPDLVVVRDVEGGVGTVKLQCA